MDAFDVGDGAGLESADSLVVEEDDDLFSGDAAVANRELLSATDASVAEVDLADLSPMDNTRWSPEVSAGDPNKARAVDAPSDDLATIRSHPNFERPTPKESDAIGTIGHDDGLQTPEGWTPGGPERGG